MADQFHFDIPQHNDLFEAYVEEGFTLTFREGDWNDYVKVSGGGDVDGRLGTGNDTFDGSHLWGNATVDGGSGSDVMKGGYGEVHFFGGDNNDTLISGWGGGFFDGGAARDTIDVSKGAAEVHTSRADHPVLLGLQGTDVVKGFGCDDTASLDGWGQNLHWDSSDAWLKDGANNKVEYFEGHIGDTLERTVFDAATLHSEWHLA